MQWAADITKTELISDPPHWKLPCKVLMKTRAWWGNWPVKAGRPFTILGTTFDLSGRTSNSTEIFSKPSSAHDEAIITINASTFIEEFSLKHCDWLKFTKGSRLLYGKSERKCLVCIRLRLRTQEESHRNIRQIRQNNFFIHPVSSVYCLVSDSRLHVSSYLLRLWLKTYETTIWRAFLLSPLRWLSLVTLVLLKIIPKTS